MMLLLTTEHFHIKKMTYSNFCFTLLHEENVFKTVNRSVLEKDHLEVNSIRFYW